MTERKRGDAAARRAAAVRTCALSDEAAPPLLGDAAAVLIAFLSARARTLELAVLAHDAAVEVDVAVDLGGQAPSQRRRAARARPRGPSARSRPRRARAPRAHVPRRRRGRAARLRRRAARWPARRRRPAPSRRAARRGPHCAFGELELEELDIVDQPARRVCAPYSTTAAFFCSARRSTRAFIAAAAARLLVVLGPLLETLGLPAREERALLLVRAQPSHASASCAGRG